MKGQRVIFILKLRHQAHKKISDLVEAGRCVVVGGKKYNVIGDIRYEDP